MNSLTPEQRALGRENANTALGVSRRDFLRAAAAAPALGAFYFGYQTMEGANPVRTAIIGTGNEGCGAMIKDHNREYLDYIGFCDIRPSQQKRAIQAFTDHPQYTASDVRKIKQYADYREMLEDDDVEMVVVALPLHLHAPVSIAAMRAGKHVFCEKLMAHNISECKEMCRVAVETDRLLGIGHQRHYSVLYDNANYLIQNGHLGDIRHIRAYWHRNNAIPKIARHADGSLKYDPVTREPIFERDEHGNLVYFDSWKPDIPIDDQSVDFAKHDYQSLEELVRWRLFNRTGAGLMAELGSHQLDACSIFLGKKHPLSVQGVGGKHFFTDDREVEDHIYVTFEFPGPSDGQRVVVTYSSINTNAFDGYGEQVMGSRGTMIIDQEKELLLYREHDRNPGRGGGDPRSTAITMERRGAGQPVMEASPSVAGPTAAASLGGLATADPSRGYREELEHFAYCIRQGGGGSAQTDYHGDTEHQPRCSGPVALVDAVVALTANIAMRENQRIEFDERWFDYTAPEVPERSAHRFARRG